LRLKAGRLEPGVKLARNSPPRCHWSPHSRPEAGARLAPIPRTACQCLAKRQRALFTPSFVGTRLNPPVTFVGTRTHLIIALFHTRTHPLVAMSGEHPAPTSPGSSHGRIFVLWPARIRPHVVASLSACSSTHPSPLFAPGPTRSSPLSARGPACPSSLSTPYPTRSSSLSGDHPPRASALSGECPAPTSPRSPHDRTFVLWPVRIRPPVFASLSARSPTRSSPLSARGPT
jgi:hypothetical protein